MSTLQIVQRDTDAEGAPVSETGSVRSTSRLAAIFAQTSAPVAEGRPTARSCDLTIRRMAETPEGRGRVHVKGGTLAATASAWAGPVEVLVRTRLVFLWAEVAIEQEVRAREGREGLERAHATREEPFDMRAELQPAMIAVAACAHSLDALYAELAEHVGPETLAEWEQTRRGGRWAEIAGVLELSVNADVGSWRPRLRKLFVELRNPAVHPKAKAGRPVRHPALPTNVPPEYAIWCVEAVRDSVDLLLEILSTCVAAPKPVSRRGPATRAAWWIS